jgi:hypothetical protein
MNGFSCELNPYERVPIVLLQPIDVSINVDLLEFYIIGGGTLLGGIQRKVSMETPGTFQKLFQLQITIIHHSILKIKFSHAGNCNSCDHNDHQNRKYQTAL